MEKMLLVFLFAAAVGLSGQESGDTILPGRRLDDASVDRNLLVPSAETIPAKTCSRFRWEGSS